QADRGGRRPAHAGRTEDHLSAQLERAMIGEKDSSAAPDPAGDPEISNEEKALPRQGASPSELDARRASIKVATRPKPTHPRPKASAPPPPPAQAIIHRGEIDRIIDEGRALLESDTKGAHDIFQQAWRRNLNDPRVLSNYGLTLVLVEGD